MKKRYWLGIAVSILLVFLLFRSVQLTSVLQAFREANLLYLLPALVLYFVGVLARAARWQLLLSPVQRLGLRRLYLVLVVGYMANDILPLRAGEAVRAYMLWQKERIPPGATVATILVERIFDGLALTGFLVIGAMMIQLDDSLVWLTRVAGTVFVVGVLAVVALAVAPQFTMRIAAAVLSPLPGRFSDLALRVMRSFEDGLRILRSGSETAIVLFLSVAAWLLEASMYYMLMFSFSFQPRYIAAVLGTAVANLASMIPSSPGYVGTFDVGLLNVLSGTFRVDASHAAAYTALVHAALIGPVTLLGIFFVWREGLSLRRLAAGNEYDRAAGADANDNTEAVARRSIS
jgi:glycosyltransferase 2 family protein